VPFHIHFRDDAEQAYYDGLPLSPRAKESLDRLIEQEIANVSDEFRLDPQNRPDPGKPCFLFQRMLLDVWGDRCFHTIDFYIRDEAAKYGVLVIAYIEHRRGQSSGTDLLTL
jgi:hypothetical protein